MLQPLEVVLGDHKKAFILIDDRGLTIDSAGDKLSLNELHLLSSLAFIYLGTYQKGIIIDAGAVLHLGTKLYNSFYEKYSGFKTIGEMSLDEFNEEMRRYERRGEGGKQ